MSAINESPPFLNVHSPTKPQHPILLFGVLGQEAHTFLDKSLQSQIKFDLEQVIKIRKFIQRGILKIQTATDHDPELRLSAFSDDEHIFKELQNSNQLDIKDFWKNCMNGFLYFFAKEKQMLKLPEDYLFEKLLKRFLIEERSSKERNVIEKCSKLSDYFKYSQKTFTHALEYIDSFKKESHDELVTLLIYQVLKVLLEKVKSNEFPSDLKHKITRKLGVCEKLIMFFDENKKTTALRSFEYISTAVMISAKIFENEENVRTFAKHSQFCDASTKKLKSIELEFLERSEWDIDHESQIDFGLHFVSNFLFRQNDLVKDLTKKKQAGQKLVHIKSLIGKDNSEFLEAICGQKMGDFLKNQSVRSVDSWSEEEAKKISKTIYGDFKVVLREILKKYVLKSSLRAILIMWTAILVKEAHCGMGFWIRYKLKTALIENLEKSIKEIRQEQSVWNRNSKTDKASTSESYFQSPMRNNKKLSKIIYEIRRAKKVLQGIINWEKKRFMENLSFLNYNEEDKEKLLKLTWNFQKVAFASLLKAAKIKEEQERRGKEKRRGETLSFALVRKLGIRALKNGSQENNRIIINNLDAFEDFCLLTQREYEIENEKKIEAAGDKLSSNSSPKKMIDWLSKKIKVFLNEDGTNVELQESLDRAVSILETRSAERVGKKLQINETKTQSDNQTVLIQMALSTKSIREKGSRERSLHKNATEKRNYEQPRKKSQPIRKDLLRPSMYSTETDVLNQEAVVLKPDFIDQKLNAQVSREYLRENESPIPSPKMHGRSPTYRHTLAALKSQSSLNKPNLSVNASKSSLKDKLKSLRKRNDGVLRASNFTHNTKNNKAYAPFHTKRSEIAHPKFLQSYHSNLNQEPKPNMLVSQKLPRDLRSGRSLASQESEQVNGSLALFGADAKGRRKEKLSAALQQMNRRAKMTQKLLRGSQNQSQLSTYFNKRGSKQSRISRPNRNGTFHTIQKEQIDQSQAKPLYNTQNKLPTRNRDVRRNKNGLRMPRDSMHSYGLSVKSKDLLSVDKSPGKLSNLALMTSNLKSQDLGKETLVSQFSLQQFNTEDASESDHLKPRNINNRKKKLDKSVEIKTSVLKNGIGKHSKHQKYLSMNFDLMKILEKQKRTSVLKSQVSHMNEESGHYAPVGNMKGRRPRRRLLKNTEKRTHKVGMMKSLVSHTQKTEYPKILNSQMQDRPKNKKKKNLYSIRKSKTQHPTRDRLPTTTNQYRKTDSKNVSRGPSKKKRGKETFPQTVQSLNMFGKLLRSEADHIQDRNFKLKEKTKNRTGGKTGSVRRRRKSRSENSEAGLNRILKNSNTGLKSSLPQSHLAQKPKVRGKNLSSYGGGANTTTTAKAFKIKSRKKRVMRSRKDSKSGNFNDLMRAANKKRFLGESSTKQKGYFFSQFGVNKKTKQKKSKRQTDPRVAALLQADHRHSNF